MAEPLNPRPQGYMATLDPGLKDPRGSSEACRGKIDINPIDHKPYGCSLTDNNLVDHKLSMGEHLLKLTAGI